MSEELKQKIRSVAHVQESVRGMLIDEIMDDIAALAAQPSPAAVAGRMPLTDAQIQAGHDAADIAPTDATIGTFIDGVRFAEAAHAITAAPAPAATKGE